MAKPTPYKPAVGERICACVAEGKGLAAIAALPGMPTHDVMRGWLERHPEFEMAYERARRWRADHLVDEALALVDGVLGSTDNAAVTAARNAADLRKWLASKLLPSRFGDRIEVAGDPDAPLISAEVDTGKLALALVNVLQAAKKAEPLPPVTIDAEPADAQPERAGLLSTYGPDLADPALASPENDDLASARRAHALFGSAPPSPPPRQNDVEGLRRERAAGRIPWLSRAELGLPDDTPQLRAIKGGRR